jgi:hypothetical protein
MRRTRPGAATVAALVALVLPLALLVGSAPTSLAIGQCPNLLLREGDVPDWLWALAPEPATSLADSAGQIAALEAQSTVDQVEYLPPLPMVPTGDPWILDFGFAPAAPGVEDFTYNPVVCLGGRVPDVVGRSAGEADDLVIAAGLEPATEAASSDTVTEIDPDAGQILSFGSAVSMTAVARAAPALTRDVAVADLVVLELGDREMLVSAAIVNVGQVAVDSAGLLVQYDGTRLDEFETGRLDPADRVDYERSFTVAPQPDDRPGTVVASLTTTDDNPDNDRRSQTVVLSSETGTELPDLVVTDLSITSQGGTIVVDLLVVNLGPGSADETSVLVDVDGEEATRLTVPPLAADSPYPLSAILPLADDAVEVAVAATVDPDELVAERDDDNNSASDIVPLSVTRPDTSRGSEGPSVGGPSAVAWVVILGALIAAGGAGRAMRARRRRRERDWVRQHVHAEPRRGASTSDIEPRAGERSHTMRIHADRGTSQSWVEEVTP